MHMLAYDKTVSILVIVAILLLAAETIYYIYATAVDPKTESIVGLVLSILLCIFVIVIFNRMFRLTPQLIKASVENCYASLQPKIV